MSEKKKFYILNMFPYPSGVGLHVGHASNYIITDIMARFLKLKGYDVINPIGRDSFGLPTENFALKVNKPADVVTKENIATFKKQILKMKIDYDRDREITTSSPEYYKRTQRIFEKLFEKGLVYRKRAFVNRCPSCQTVLANDQVVNGRCERCDSEVIQKEHLQRFIKITDYADRLIQDLDKLDRPEETKQAQRNWIGKSEGAEINFIVGSEKITVFTTRPETVYGVTAIVLAPEITSYDTEIPQDHLDKVIEYRKTTAGKTSVERQQGEKDKTGVFSGFFAVHPLTNEKIPVWYADYVLSDYGTGAVMFVPSHDERDYEFAKKNGLDFKKIIETEEEFYDGDGKLINSGDLNGLNIKEAKAKIIEIISDKKAGNKKTTYRLRDRSVSRQRYRGCPIPVYYDEENKANLIPNDELPVILPLDLKEYKPQGKSPLENHEAFKNYKHKNGNTYVRECDTLDTFMCSSFYFLRFIDPKNDSELGSKDLLNKYMPVDLYIGGKEHTVGHLIYARFINKFLFDIGAISHDEPFQKLFHQGMVSGPDGRKMSKRRGNIITPDDIIDNYGVDTLRTYEMFMGPLDAEKNWDENGVKGIKRFLDRVLNLEQFISSENSEETEVEINKTIAGVTQDIENMKYNTAISKLMIFTNHVYGVKNMSKSTFEKFLIILHPFAIELTEELYKKINGSNIKTTTRPSFDESKINIGLINLPVQINGKTRLSLDINKGSTEKELIETIKSHPQGSKYLDGGEIKKVIYIQDKILNILI